MQPTSQVSNLISANGSVRELLDEGGVADFVDAAVPFRAGAGEHLLLLFFGQRSLFELLTIRCGLRHIGGKALVK